MRNIITGLIILGILGGAAYFMTKEDGQQSKVRTIMNDRDFIVPREDIHKVFVAHKSLTPYTLDRKGDSWYYNGDEFKISEFVIPTILSVFDRTQVNHIPPGPAVDNIVHSMRRGGIKVQLFGKNDKLLKTMYVGSDVADGNGTYMLLEGSNQPYAMELKNLTGGFRHRFMITEDRMRSRVIVQQKPENIESVGVRYPSDDSQSWRADRTASGFSLSHPSGDKPTITAEAAKIDAYLHTLDRIALEGWDLRNKTQDSIAQIEPFAEITIDVKEGRDQVIKLIPFRDFIDPELHIHEVEASKLVTRYYVVDELGRLGVGQQRVIGKLLVGYDFFAEEAM
jgi:hypothetical protein